MISIITSQFNCCEHHKRNFSRLQSWQSGLLCPKPTDLVAFKILVKHAQCESSGMLHHICSSKHCPSGGRCCLAENALSVWTCTHWGWSCGKSRLERHQTPAACEPPGVSCCRNGDNYNSGRGRLAQRLHANFLDLRSGVLFLQTLIPDKAKCRLGQLHTVCLLPSDKYMPVYGSSAPWPQGMISKSSRNMVAPSQCPCACSRPA